MRILLKAHEFDAAFDAGEGITDSLDLTQARRPGQHHRRVNVEFPSWVVDSLDREAERLGVSRQTVIQLWITERLRTRSA